MPYIRDNEGYRGLLEPECCVAQGPGELNYQITCLLNQYKAHKKLSYQTINDILGALEGAKQEFYRRVAVPYEEEKRQENGDVY